MTKRKSSNKKAGGKKKRSADGEKGIECSAEVKQFFDKRDAKAAMAAFKENARRLCADHATAVELQEDAGETAIDYSTEYLEAAVWVNNLAAEVEEITGSDQLLQGGAEDLGCAGEGEKGGACWRGGR